MGEVGGNCTKLQNILPTNGWKPTAIGREQGLKGTGSVHPVHPSHI